MTFGGIVLIVILLGIMCAPAAARQARRDQATGTEPCKHCGKRRGYDWLHQRADGWRDLRYGCNPLRCRACRKFKDAPVEKKSNTP